MGSLFHLPVILIGLEEIVAFLKEKKVVVLATALGGENLYSVDLAGAIAWMFGAEGSGLTEEQKKLADRLVEIPILGKAESLNVAAASAVCLYETVRRRLK
jgi:TrmH family RNA methyltransferase